MTTAWILNLDAEHELEAPRAYAPTGRLRAIVAAQRATLLGSLVPIGDLVLEAREGRVGSGTERWRALEVTGPGAARERLVARDELAGRPAVAWSPTAGVRRLVEGSGLELATLPVGPWSGAAGAPPDHALLARVNARPFAADLRRALPGDAFARDVVAELEPLLALLARPAPLGWLVRRSFGAAGRGRRRLADLTARRPDEAEVAWLRASLTRGPVTVEPWVEVVTEYTRSGLVRPDGSLLLSGPCFQEVARSGAWTRTEAAAGGEVAREDDAALARALEAAGEALAAAGYHGPFGVDAFRYRDGAGGTRLNALGELNARYTMDWRPAMEGALARGD